jgi:MFS family permease
MMVREDQNAWGYMAIADVDSAVTRAKSAIYPWVIVIVLMLLFTSSFIDRQILSLLVKPIRADLDISDTEFSYLAGLSFALLYSIAGIPFGYAVDRWSRKNLIVAGVTVWSIMTVVCGLAGTYWRLFAARVGVGVGEATLSPAAYSLVSDIFPPQRLSRALSVFALGIPIGSGLALIIGGPLVQWLTELGPQDLPLFGTVKPWQAVFIAVGLPGLLLALLTALIVREPARRGAVAGQKEEPPRLSATFAHLGKNRGSYGAVFFGVSSMALIWYGGAAWYPSYLQRVHGFTVAKAGMFLGLSSVIFGILGTVFAGFLADRFLARGKTDGHLRVAMIFSAGVAVCSGLAPLVPSPTLSLALVSLNAFFAFTSVGVNAAVLQLITPNRMRGQVSALYLFTTNAIGQGLGSTAVAFSTDFVFQRDEAVGLSIALVAVVASGLGCVLMHMGRGAVSRLVVAQGHS